MKSFNRKRNCKWLMLSLFAMLLFMPFSAAGGAGTGWIMGGLSTFILISGIGVVSDSKKNQLWGAALIAPPVVVQWLSETMTPASSPFWLLPSLYYLPVFCFFGLLIFRYLFRQGELTVDHLYGAISLYLLIGLFWSNIYILLERILPGSFRFPEGVQNEGVLKSIEFVYYSYVTLTTLGYGDVTPVSHFARSLSILEALVGVLFIGAFVARIAGSFSAGPPGRS